MGRQAYSKGQRLATYHINASMLTMVNLVVAYNRIAVGSDLDASQCITMYVVALNQAPSLTKYVHTALVTIVDFVFPVEAKVLGEASGRAGGGRLFQPTSGHKAKLDEGKQAKPLFLQNNYIFPLSEHYFQTIFSVCACLVIITSMSDALSKDLVKYACPDLIVGSLLEVIHTPAKLLE